MRERSHTRPWSGTLICSNRLARFLEGRCSASSALKAPSVSCTSHTVKLNQVRHYFLPPIKPMEKKLFFWNSSKICGFTLSWSFKEENVVKLNLMFLHMCSSRLWKPLCCPHHWRWHEHHPAVEDYSNPRGSGHHSPLCLWHRLGSHQEVCKFHDKTS